MKLPPPPCAVLLVYDMLKLNSPPKDYPPNCPPKKQMALFSLHLAGPDTEKNDLSATKLSESDTNGSNDPVTPSSLDTNQKNMKKAGKVKTQEALIFFAVFGGWGGEKYVGSKIMIQLFTP